MNKHLERFERVFEKLEKEYPSMVDKITDWYPSGRNEITILVNNEQLKIYNYITSTLRNLHTSNDSEIDEDIWKTEFAKRLRQKMIFTGIGNWKLSELTGISEVSISKYTNGKTIPSVYNMNKISRALGCSMNELTDI